MLERVEIQEEGKTFVLACSIRYKAGQEGGLWGLASMDTGAGARNSWKSFFFSGTSTRAGHQSALDPEGFLFL